MIEPLTHLRAAIAGFLQAARWALTPIADGTSLGAQDELGVAVHQMRLAAISVLEACADVEEQAGLLPSKWPRCEARLRVPPATGLADRGGLNQSRTRLWPFLEGQCGYGGAFVAGGLA
jgi:hypothetical protein